MGGSMSKIWVKINKQKLIGEDMKTIFTVLISICIAIFINGCSGQKMMEPMDSEMVDMEKPMDSMESKGDDMNKKSMVAPSEPEMMDVKKTME